MTRSFSPTYSPIVSAQQPARHVRFFLLWILSVIVLRIPLAVSMNLALHDDRYSCMLLIPFISGYVFWLRRKRICLESTYCPHVGIPLLLAGIVILGNTSFLTIFLGQSAGLSVSIFAIIVIWAGLFVLCYGTQSLNCVVFPFLFLLLIVPIPANAMDRAVIGLQKGSAEMAVGLFKFVGVPFFREGFKFALPGFGIEIAEQCSGIRSSLSMFISSILAGHLFLRSGWSKMFFTLLTVPIVIFKNAVRIVTISWLGLHVNRGFLYGRLHQYGGLPFSLVGLAILVLLLLGFRKLEGRRGAVQAGKRETL